MFDKDSVCAVVVIFNGDYNLKENILSLLKQTDKVVLIDNASTVSINVYVDEFLNNDKFVFIQNDKNEGIAYAFNQGLDYARKNNYKYFLTMDQDSILDVNCVNTMIKVLKSNPGIVSVAPNYNNIQIDGEYKLVDCVISSGNLTECSVAVAVGGYENLLFIDSVDFDFSFKIRLNGYSIAIINGANMKQKIGVSEVGHWLFFKKSITTHSQERYYFMYRNNRYLIKKYKRQFKKTCFKLWLSAFVHRIEVFFFHPNAKEKLLAIKKGIKDSKDLVEK